MDWRSAINDMKGMLKRGGYITTVEKGFPLHAYPHDFWRFDLNDVRGMFSDFDIITLKRDIEHGILLKAKKPDSWIPAKLDNIDPYSVLLGRRTEKIVTIDDTPLARRLAIKFLSSKARLLMPQALIHLLEGVLTGRPS